MQSNAPQLHRTAIVPRQQVPLGFYLLLTHRWLSTSTRIFMFWDDGGKIFGRRKGLFSAIKNGSRVRIFHRLVWWCFQRRLFNYFSPFRGFWSHNEAAIEITELVMKEVHQIAGQSPRSMASKEGLEWV